VGVGWLQEEIEDYKREKRWLETSGWVLLVLVVFLWVFFRYWPAAVMTIWCVVCWVLARRKYGAR